MRTKIFKRRIVTDGHKTMEKENRLKSIRTDRKVDLRTNEIETSEIKNENVNRRDRKEIKWGECEGRKWKRERDINVDKRGRKKREKTTEGRQGGET